MWKSRINSSVQFPVGLLSDDASVFVVFKFSKQEVNAAPCFLRLSQHEVTPQWHMSQSFFHSSSASTVILECTDWDRENCCFCSCSSFVSLCVFVKGRMSCLCLNTSCSVFLLIKLPACCNLMPCYNTFNPRCDMTFICHFYWDVFQQINAEIHHHSASCSQTPAGCCEAFGAPLESAGSDKDRRAPVPLDYIPTLTP